MKKYTIEYIKNNNLILLESISGSRAYNLHNEKSDTDIRGIFIVEENDFFSLEYPDELSNETQDIKYFELSKFFKLLTANNPNILELLNMPSECILKSNIIFEKYLKELNQATLSKKCLTSFVSYAFSQVKKARGLNKKIVNPVDLDNKKDILDFISIIPIQKYQEPSKDRTILNLRDFMKNFSIKEDYLGISNVDSKRDLFKLYCDWDNLKNNKTSLFRGLGRNLYSTNFRFSNIPKEKEDDTFIGFIYYNEDGYKAYLKDYDSYKVWVENRNEERYKGNLNKNYDTKNLMHCIRLLNTALEIPTNKTINVKRKDRDYLLDIRNGKFDYESVIKIAEEKVEECNKLFKNSDLPEEPNLEKLNNLYIKIRTDFYSKINMV